MKFSSILVVLGFIAAASALPRVQRKAAVAGGGRIIGGEDAQVGQFPFMLSLQYFGSHICGAAIISDNLAVTAASCVEGDSPDSIQLVAGKHHRTQSNPNEQTKQVTKIIIHPEYDSWYFGCNDIALLEIGSDGDDSFIFNDFVSAIALPDQEQQTTSEVVVIGWGTIRGGGQLATILQHATVSTVSDADCQKMYPSEDIIPSKICAGVPDGSKDACQGDDGGPVFSMDGNYLAGIINWGYGCGRPNSPRIYTEVSYFVDWINAHLPDN